MALHCRGKKTDPGRTGSDPRLFLEAIFQRFSATGTRKWNTVFKRFRDWVKADVFKRVFDALSAAADMDRAQKGALSGRWRASAVGHFWASETQLSRIKPYFPLSHGVPRVDDRRVVSDIIHVIRNGLRWRDALEVFGPHKTLYNRFIR